MARGERPIKLGDSWFSAKSIEVDRHVFAPGGRALFGLGALPGYRIQANSEDHHVYSGSQLLGVNFSVKRETAQTAS